MFNKFEHTNFVYFFQLCIVNKDRMNRMTYLTFSTKIEFKVFLIRATESMIVVRANIRFILQVFFPKICTEQYSVSTVIAPDPLSVVIRRSI